MLRSVVLALVLAAAGAQAADAQTSNGTLSIELAGLQPQGTVMIQLFNSEAGYQSGDGVGAQRVEITGQTAHVAFDSLAPGQYAFRMFHDVNGDGRMNTNPFGIPIEPFAFSNNARGSFGPARWADAAFTLNAGANTQEITLGGAN
jgi:uncharacterized protein (DUF2141 family)